jgi:hypothetical protein
VANFPNIPSGLRHILFHFAAIEFIADLLIFCEFGSTTNPEKRELILVAWSTELFRVGKEFHKGVVLRNTIVDCGEGWEFVDQLIPHSFTELKISLRGYDEPIGCPWA